MIPKKIHYCWFGRGEMPQLAKDCVDSWHKHMPDWEYKLWNEDNFDINQIPYTKEAYEAKKYAFVSDYVRLWALNNEGGLYLDTDVIVFKSFDDLLYLSAFAGFEGSKYLPVGTCVMSSKANGLWIGEMLEAYKNRHFVIRDGIYDLTTNVQFITALMAERGLVQNGEEQNYKDLHVFPVDYFCPKQTTGEYICTENTYCEHLGLGSWVDSSGSWKSKVRGVIGKNNMVKFIKLKRKIFG